MEKWVNIDKWENLYEVSTSGKVRNIKTGKVLVGDTNNCGYRRVILYNKDRKQRFFIHRLVAQAFISNPENKPQVNHIDGNKENNSVDNLEWVSQSENEVHAIKNNLKGVWKGEFIVVFNDGKIELWDNQRDFARRINTSHTQVRNWLNKGVNSFKKYGILNLSYCDKCRTTSESVIKEKHLNEEVSSVEPQANGGLAMGS